jgi:predicted methyltransferase MtxX (methanogen marker protein 4)
MYQLKIWRLGRILSSCRVRDSGRDREIAAIMQEAEIGAGTL